MKQRLSFEGQAVFCESFMDGLLQTRLEYSWLVKKMGMDDQTAQVLGPLSGLNKVIT